jgi:hypothetical protein
MLSSHLVLAGLVFVVTAPVAAETTICQKMIVNTGRKADRVRLIEIAKCVESRNLGLSSGPCQGIMVDSKIAVADGSARAKIAKACTMADLAALGFPPDCAFEPAAQGREGFCASLPVTTPQEFARCIECWRAAEAAELLATLYASHALDVCGGDLGEAASACSGLDCPTPTPNQQNLGATPENDCQHVTGKAGINYAANREKILARCGLAGRPAMSCLTDPQIQVALDTLKSKKRATILTKCTGRDPLPNPPDAQHITWWASCPESATCPGSAVSTIDDLIGCVDTAADAIVDEIMCLQLRTRWPCPPPDGSPSGAFLN